MEDKELLKGLVAAGGQLIGLAHSQLGTSWGRVTDDKRWPYPLPLRLDIQLRHLLVASLDAADLALGALNVRISPASLGAVRLLAENYALVRWLVEPDNRKLRQARANSLMRKTLERVKDLQARGEMPEWASPGEEWDEIEGKLSSITAEDGVKFEVVPSKRNLFDAYVPQPGYLVFSLLSEIGSHPGLLQVVSHFKDPSSKEINVDLSGGIVDRAYYSSMVFDFLARTADEIGRVLEWEEWLGEVKGHVIDTLPLLSKAKERWEQRWRLAATGEGNPPDDEVPKTVL